jgi:hypothetical protein
MIWRNNVFEHQRENAVRQYTVKGVRVVFDKPKETERYTADELKAMGLVGVYVVEETSNG